MSVRAKLALLAAPVALLGAVPTAASRPAGPSPSELAGKQLYRKYCSECHTIAYCLCAGFRTGKSFGADEGPDFQHLRLSFNTTITAVEGGAAGHELVLKEITWRELQQVARFVAAATKHHSPRTPYPS